MSGRVRGLLYWIVGSTLRDHHIGNFRHVSVLPLRELPPLVDNYPAYAYLPRHFRASRSPIIAPTTERTEQSDGPCQIQP